MNKSTEASRERRRKHGGMTLTDRANNRAVYNAVKWVRINHPDLWRKLLAEARAEFGLSTDMIPGGTYFTKPIVHGTTAGYAAHLRRGEPPCEACREAKSRYDQAFRALRKARSGAS